MTSKHSLIPLPQLQLPTVSVVFGRTHTTAIETMIVTEMIDPNAAIEIGTETVRATATVIVNAETGVETMPAGVEIMKQEMI